MWFVKTLVVEAANANAADTLFIDCLSGEPNAVQVSSAQIEGELTKRQLDTAFSNAGLQYKEKLALRDNKREGRNA